MAELVTLTLESNHDVQIAAQRLAQARARIAPEAEQADFLMDTGLAWEASPLPSYFRYARITGEQNARKQLPQLLAQLQSAGLWTPPKNERSAP